MATPKTTVKKKKAPGPLPVLPPPPTTGPAATAPAIPANFQALTREQALQLKKATVAQASSAGAVATELAASKTYVDDFGAKAVAQATVVAQLNTAAAWEVEHERAKAYEIFARAQSGLAWNAALASTESLNADAIAQSKHDPSIPGRYPVTRAFTTARRAAAQRAVATKKAKKKTAPTAPAAAAPAPATPAKSG
jgi:hypothetical protein